MIFAFGQHQLDVGCFELRREGRVVEVQAKVLELLLYLVRNRERAVPKQEILEAVWPDTAVTEGSLIRAVSLARRAIGDRGDPPSMIITVPRRGYRFVAPLHAAAEPSVRGAGEPSHRDEPTSHYVGRGLLLARLGELLDLAVQGRGRILFLAGESGIGKTRTAEILAERAERAGGQVATAWGLERGDPPLWTWTRVLRSLKGSLPEAVACLTPEQRSDLARLVPELGGHRAMMPLPTRDSASARFGLFEAVKEHISRCAAMRPVALFLDDLQSADAESLWLLEFIGQTIGRLPIAIVVTCREDEAGRAPQHARALERLLRLTSLERWSLEGLSGEEIREFACMRLGKEPDLELVNALERKTGGNPLLLGESLRSLEARSLLGGQRESSAWEALLPRGIGHLLRPKLRHLSRAAVEALACAAAIGSELDPQLLARSTLEPAELDAPLRELEEAGLLFRSGAPTGRLRFAHQLIREALYAELVPPGDVRQALHARIESALEDRASPSDEALAERAHHACEAAPLVDPSRAIALARAAGERALELGDFECAAAWFQRALDVLELGGTIEPAARATLLIALAAAQSRAFGLERARPGYRRAADEARSLGGGDLLAEAALGFAHRPIATGDGDPEVIELLEEALATLPSASNALRIRLLSRLAGELRYSERPRAEALAEEAVAAARQLGDPAVLAQALDDASYVRWSSADPVGWLALNAEIVRAAKASNDLDLMLRGQKGRVTGFLELGDLAGVGREIRACERTAEKLRTPYARWLRAALRAMRALLDGDLEAAERHIRETIHLGERVDSLEVVLELQTQLFCLRLEQGRAAEIEPAARAQIQRFPDAPAWRAALGRILVAAGRLNEARRELEQLAGARFADVPRDRGWLPTLALSAEVSFATGDAQAAEALEPLLAPYAQLSVVPGSGLLYYGSVSHHLGLAAATRSRWDAAIACFEAALEMERKAGAGIWVARTQAAYARALLSRQAPADSPRAAKLLTEAKMTARAQGFSDVSESLRDLETAVWKRRPLAPRARDTPKRGQS